MSRTNKPFLKTVTRKIRESEIGPTVSVIERFFEREVKYQSQHNSKSNIASKILSTTTDESNLNEKTFEFEDNDTEFEINFEGRLILFTNIYSAEDFGWLGFDEFIQIMSEI